jgi:hypothetical protein
MGDSFKIVERSEHRHCPVDPGGDDRASPKIGWALPPGHYTSPATHESSRLRSSDG